MLRPPSGWACASPTRDGSFRQAHAWPTDFLVRQEASVIAIGVDGAASSGIVRFVGAGAGGVIGVAGVIGVCGIAGS